MLQIVFSKIFKNPEDHYPVKVTKADKDFKDTKLKKKVSLASFFLVTKVRNSIKFMYQ